MSDERKIPSQEWVENVRNLYRARDGNVLTRGDESRDVTALCDAVSALRAENDELRTLRPLSEWHEDHGPVLMWFVPVREPPYAGTPLDDDAPDYMTHFSKIPNVWDTPATVSSPEARDPS